MVQHSGAPLLSLGEVQHSPPYPGSEKRVQQHHLWCNNNPMQESLLGQWDTWREAGVSRGMKMGQDRGLRLYDVHGVHWLMGLSVYMGSRGNEADVSLEG